MWQKSGTVPPKAGRLAGLVLRNTVANKLNASLQIVGDDNVCAQTGVLKHWCSVRQMVSILAISQYDDHGRSDRFGIITR